MGSWVVCGYGLRWEAGKLVGELGRTGGRVGQVDVRLIGMVERWCVLIKRT